MSAKKAYEIRMKPAAQQLSDEPVIVEGLDPRIRELVAEMISEIPPITSLQKETATTRAFVRFERHTFNYRAELRREVSFLDGTPTAVAALSAGTKGENLGR